MNASCCKPAQTHPTGSLVDCSYRVVRFLVLLLIIIVLGRFTGGVHFGEVVGFPLGAAFFEDAGEELLTGLAAATLIAGELGLGWRFRETAARYCTAWRPLQFSEWLSYLIMLFTFTSVAAQAWPLA